ncbi:proline-rich receptor-like protein kinase PERK10 [Brassica napus]|uniref:proline-rich receptor-like protein kinase PERK10 n=1 Tax=Brassica napus TaxID=3708 RepID=UPI0020791170|nr:proline-rich receptor-like protein kinase PERK10 [Brassica napus]XP_048627555.1 proline-rich receptor-like protein kinase PERK10 [Brassica napus]
MAGTSTKKVRKPSKRSKPSPLPPQYEFTPRTTEPPPRGNRRAGPTVSDYPPPRQLFEESTPRTQPRAASTPLSQPAPPPQPRGSQISANVRPRQPTVSIRRQSPISSEAQNSQNTEAPEGPDEDEPVPNSPFPVEPNLSEDQTRLPNALLSQPGRERYTMSLSPTFEPGTMWLVTYLSEYFKLMRLCL